jgi:polyisoprenoid-binding protein YceI
MKLTRNLIVLSAMVIIGAACSGGGQKTETSEARETTVKSSDLMYSVDLNESYVAWEGYKPTGKHDGTVSLLSGKLNFKGDDLVGGEFVMDMNSITVLDLTDEDSNAKLTGHLKSDDFFDVEKYPTARFVITDVEAIDASQVAPDKERGDIVPTHAISGNLSMKDVTKNITFNAKVSRDGDRFVAETNQFFIDRVVWNVQYGSKTLFANLQDNFINDEMGLNIHLEVTRSAGETAVN